VLRHAGSHDACDAAVELEEGLVSDIDHKNVADPDETLDWGERGSSVKSTLGWSGYGLGNESTIWVSTLNPRWSWSATASSSMSPQPRRGLECLSSAAT
jgi:hypothetical protein